MGDHPDLKDLQTGRPDDTSDDSAALARVLRDVERCEALIAHGARTAAPVEDADIEIVRVTRLAVEQKTLSAASEADFRAAMGRMSEPSGIQTRRSPTTWTVVAIRSPMQGAWASSSRRATLSSGRTRVPRSRRWPGMQ